MKVLVIGLLALVIGPAANATGVDAQISQVGDAVHIEFKGKSHWDYNIEKKQNKNKTRVEIEVARLSEPSVMALKSWKHPLIDSMNIRHDGPDGKDLIIINFKAEDLDAFDYLTDQPSRLIVDFFRTIKKTAKAVDKSKDQVLEKTNKKSRQNKRSNVAKNKKVKSSRRPASSDVIKVSNLGSLGASASQAEKTSGIFDGGDPNYERFTIKDYEIKEDAIIAAQENYYIDFPMLEMPNIQLAKLNSLQPIYEITPKDTEENKTARLLQTLFEKKRYNVFLETVNWFNKKFPNSEYDEIVRFMWADAHFMLWTQSKNAEDFDMAMVRYRQAIQKYPKSPLSERTQMLMGFASLDRGDYLATIKLFDKYIREHASSEPRDIARLAIGEALMRLGQYDEAKTVFDEVEKEATSRKYQSQAAYMRGDVYFRNKDYKKAVEEYLSAIEKYPESSGEFPNAYYNRASALFKEKKYKESLNANLEFLKRFPSHTYAAYAMTRVGELLDIMGADKTRVLGAYLETQFRYGDSEGALVARLRLLSSRMKNMKTAELEKTIQELSALVQKSDLKKIDQFENIMVADGYAERDGYEKAIDLLVKYYQKNPISADTDVLKNRIVKYINADIKNKVDSGNFLDAMKIYKNYSDNWLKGSDRIDTKFNLARAYEQAGVNSEAEVLYRYSLNHILALKGTQGEKERNIFEKLPSTDELDLRLAQTELQLDHSSQSYDYIKQIKNPQRLSDTQQIERVQLEAQLLEKKGDLESATRYLVELIKTWKGIPELVADPYMSLAKLQVKTGKKQDAIQSLQKIDELMADSQGKVPQDIHSKSLEMLGDLQLQLGQIEKATASYEKLLKTYEASKPMPAIRYKVGSLYFQRGELKKAEDVWAGLAGNKSEFWSKLAQEQLNNSNWNNEYKKYIKRIPAMSERN